MDVENFFKKKKKKKKKKLDWRLQRSKSDSKGYSNFSDCMASYGYQHSYGEK